MSHFKALLFTLAVGAGGFPAPGAFARCADLALVLAIDGSGSIDLRDFSLQQTGYAAAFRDNRVQAALASAGIVDVAVVVWGDEEMPAQVMDWQRLTGPGDTDRLAADIAGMPRKVTGDTGIGSGLSVALDLLDRDQACAVRRIINVSGDGRESFGPRPRHHIPLTKARARAEAMGVTINALAVTASAPGLEVYYRERVILGPEAFVMAVTRYADFAEAIARKLAREIALPVVAELTYERMLQP
jgi:hypothetical protein